MTHPRSVAGSIFLLLACLAAVPACANEHIWTVLAPDSMRDSRDSSADAAVLSYRYERPQDVLWFRIALYGAANTEAFGVNVAVDTGTDADKMNWWGANKVFKFDRLVTAWVTRRRDRYQGTIGVANAAGARAGKFDNLRQDNLQLRVQGDSILVGIKRTDLTDKMKFDLIAALGSSQASNDDVPDVGSVTLDLAAPRPTRGLREIDVSRNNFKLPPQYHTLSEDQPPQISRQGHGRTELILVPGVYSGQEVFAGFIARHRSRYKFHVVTPPGLNRTPARPLPPETTSYAELTWTRRLARDILDLIRGERLERPVVITQGFPGSLAAEELASRHPAVLGGIIEIASMPLQFFASPADPTRKKAATPDERAQIVNEGLAAKWFKYVTPETWESNNYAAAMFLNDPQRAEQLRQQVEAVPLPVKIRYLTEFMASDHSRELIALEVPLLVLRPGFNAQLLADPAHGWYKSSFQDSWDVFAENSRIQLVTIPDARALILEDQPQLADEALVTFIEHVSRANDL